MFLRDEPALVSCCTDCWLEAAHQKRGLGRKAARGFRAWQLGPWLAGPLPCSAMFVRGIPMASNKCLMKHLWDVPSGPVVKSRLSIAGNAGSSPQWRAETPHSVGQLSPRATAR